MKGESIVINSETCPDCGKPCNLTYIEDYTLEYSMKDIKLKRVVNPKPRICVNLCSDCRYPALLEYAHKTIKEWKQLEEHEEDN